MANLKRELALEGIITTHEIFKSIMVFLTVYFMVRNTQCMWLPADWATKESFKSPLSVSWWCIGWEWWADCFLHTKKTFGTENDNDGATVCQQTRVWSGAHSAWNFSLHVTFVYESTFQLECYCRKCFKRKNTPRKLKYKQSTCERSMSGLAFPSKELHTL